MFVTEDFTSTSEHPRKPETSVLLSGYFRAVPFATRTAGATDRLGSLPSARHDNRQVTQMPRLNRLTSLVLALLVASAAGGQEKLPATAVLPESTVGIVRIADVTELRAAFAESAIGKIADDPQMRPLLGSLYGGVADLFTEIGERIGADLDELLDLPQGEFAVAVVRVEATEDRPESGDSEPRDESPEALRRRIEERRKSRRQALQPVLIVDAAARIPLLVNVLEREAERQVARGGVRRSEAIAGVEVVTIERGGRARLVYAERAGTAVIGISTGVVGDVLRRMAGESLGRTLSQNTDFTAAVTAGTADPDGQPQIVFFVDPEQILEAIAQSGGPAAMTYQILDSFGLDGFEGIGGTLRISGEQFESVTHIHVLLDSTREGVLAVVQPKAGKLVPESFVPADVGGYITLRWDLVKTARAIGRIVNRVMGAGFWEDNIVAQVEQRSGVDPLQGLLPHMSGRISVVQWNEPPARVGSQTNAFIFELSDADAFRASLVTMLDKAIPQHQKESYLGATLYKIADPPDRGARSEFLRVGTPHIVLFDSYAMYTDSRQLAERIIQTHSDPDSPRMLDLPELDLILAEITARLDGREPFMISFGQPEQTYRFIYDLAQSPGSRQALKSLAEKNPVAAVVLGALEENKLPPFSVISQHLAPTGGVMFDEAAGLHSVSFSLRPIE